MSEGNIRQLMETAFQSLLEMMDVNTVVGDMVETEGKVSVIPISRVSCGFVAGGGEFGSSDKKDGEQPLPFAGGSGAGLSVSPAGFLVGSGSSVRFIAVDNAGGWERLIDAIPVFLELLGKRD